MAKTIKVNPVYRSVDEVPTNHLVKEYLMTAEAVNMTECSPIPLQELIDKLSTFRKDSNVELSMDYSDYYPSCIGLTISWQVLETDEQFNDRIEKYKRDMFRRFMDPDLKAEETKRKRSEKAKKKQEEREAAEKALYFQLKEKWGNIDVQ